ncbi:MAG: ComEC/Rec2 family competence protein [Chitinophagaceae bacterium]
MPLLRPLIALILGISVGYAFPDWDKWPLLVMVVLLLAGVMLYQFVPYRWRLHLYWLAGMALLGIFFLLGYWSVLRKDVTRHGDWLGNNKDSIATYLLVLDENPMPKTKNYLAVGKLVAKQKDSQRTTSSSGKILLRIDTAIQNQHHLLAGDTLSIHAKIRRIQTSPNGNFDAATYYKHLQIYHQTYIQTRQLVAVHHNASKGSRHFFQKSRYWILSQLRAHIPEKENQSLAEALLIGYKDDFDKNLENAYRDAGIVHIIAISGMHLMLLYKLLEQTGLLLSKSLTAKKLTKLLSLLAIWLFAFLSGAGPSVIRAAAMLSFIVVGELLYRNHNSLNSLVASAFILLLIRPEWIWNVGFWLSYMAVLGILLFYRPILRLPDFGNPLVRTLWEGIAVTLSAQILTLPIMMYCFGKVPLYFLFTNLLMMPLSSIILYMLVVLLVVSWLPSVVHIVGKCTDYCIGLMNGFVRHVAQYPFANISVSISFVQMLVMYAVIGLVVYFIKTRALRHEV